MRIVDSGRDQDMARISPSCWRRNGRLVEPRGAKGLWIRRPQASPRQAQRVLSSTSRLVGDMRVRKDWGAGLPASARQVPRGILCWRQVAARDGRPKPSGP